MVWRHWKRTRNLKRGNWELSDDECDFAGQETNSSRLQGNAGTVPGNHSRCEQAARVR